MKITHFESRKNDFFRKYGSFIKITLLKILEILNFPWCDYHNAYWEKIVTEFRTNKEYEVSTTDSHPNEKGHKLLADRIWEDYVNLKLR